MTRIAAVSTPETRTSSERGFNNYWSCLRPAPVNESRKKTTTSMNDCGAL